jgi:hypothetical protein
VTDGEDWRRYGGNERTGYRTDGIFRSTQSLALRAAVAGSTPRLDASAPSTTIGVVGGFGTTARSGSLSGCSAGLIAVRSVLSTNPVRATTFRAWHRSVGRRETRRGAVKDFPDGSSSADRWRHRDLAFQGHGSNETDRVRGRGVPVVPPPDECGCARRPAVPRPTDRLSTTAHARLPHGHVSLPPHCLSLVEGLLEDLLENLRAAGVLFEP